MNEIYVSKAKRGSFSGVDYGVTVEQIVYSYIAFFGHDGISQLCVGSLGNRTVLKIALMTVYKAISSNRCGPKTRGEIMKLYDALNGNIIDLEKVMGNASVCDVIDRFMCERRIYTYTGIVNYVGICPDTLSKAYRGDNMSICVKYKIARLQYELLHDLPMNWHLSKKQADEKKILPILRAR